MKSYKDAIETVLHYGKMKKARNGNTISYFNLNIRHNMSEGFPLLTTKFMNFKFILAEFLWILSGENHIRNLSKHTKIWNAFADDDGKLESAYGFFMRNYPAPVGAIIPNDTNIFAHIDQLSYIIDTIKHDPNSRRMVMLSWEPSNAINSTLPPCHFAYVFSMLEGKLNLHITQRSGDLALGIPYDLAVFGLMLLTVAKVCNVKPGELAFTIVDAHIYEPHVSNLVQQLKRKEFELPFVEISQTKNINGYTFEDFILKYYQSHSPLKFDLIP